MHGAAVFSRDDHAASGSNFWTTSAITTSAFSSPPSESAQSARYQPNSVTSMRWSAGASAMMLDAALEEVANKTPGGPQLKKLNALRQKLQGAINGSPAAILSCIKDVNEALR